jgi:solute carrier family 25, member 33/36
MAQDHGTARAESMMPGQRPLDERARALLADDIPLVESREIGDIVPDTRQQAAVLPAGASPFAKSWVHFVAGG